MKANADIREYARESGIMLWQIALKLKCHESTLIRNLREELAPEKKEEIIQIINELKNEV